MKPGPNTAKNASTRSLAEVMKRNPCALLACFGMLVTFFLATSELQMKANARYPHWPASAVVSGIVDVLHIHSCKQSTPKVRVVVGFHDLLAAIVEGSVS